MFAPALDTGAMDTAAESWVGASQKMLAGELAPHSSAPGPTLQYHPLDANGHQCPFSLGTSLPDLKADHCIKYQWVIW